MRPPYRALENHIFDELRNQTDRGAAIIGGAIVEHYLARAILTRMRELSNTRYDDLFEGRGPLTSMSAKIDLGFALNIYGEKTHFDLTAVNWIRNRFAHNITGEPWSFETQKIEERCASFQLIEIVAIPIYGRGKLEKNTPRGKFIASVWTLASQLDGEAIDNPIALTPPK